MNNFPDNLNMTPLLQPIINELIFKCFNMFPLYVAIFIGGLINNQLHCMFRLQSRWLFFYISKQYLYIKESQQHNINHSADC